MGCSPTSPFYILHFPRFGVDGIVAVKAARAELAARTGHRLEQIGQGKKFEAVRPDEAAISSTLRLWPISSSLVAVSMPK